MSTDNPQNPPAATPAEEQEAASVYDALKVDELREEAERRNAGRDKADHVATQGTKPVLVAALVDDDADQTKSKPVRLQLGDDEPIEVLKPSAEYNNFVFGYGYVEV